MFEVGGKIRCVDATYSDERLTFGKIYTLLGYCPKAKEATFEVECDQGYKSRWKEGRFVKAFEVGNRVKCIDDADFCFLTVDRIYEVIKIEEDKLGLKTLDTNVISFTIYPNKLFAKEEIIFEVGNRVKLQDEKGYVDKIIDDEIWIKWDNRSATWAFESYWIEQGLTIIEEATMSKYQEIKERIENVKGWDKEADDILRELTTNRKYELCIFNCSDHSGKFCIYPHGQCHYNPWGFGVGDWLFRADFSTLQCDKLDAGKQALLWLLDHSDIKDEKEEKIKDLEYQRDTFATQIRSLNLKIEELRR